MMGYTTEYKNLLEDYGKLEQSFNAELSAAKNDYARYKQLEAENCALKELLSEAMFAHKSGWFDLDLLDRMQDALLKGGEDETE